MSGSWLGIRGGNGALKHWMLALPILLAVALLGIGQVDHLPPRTDEFISMYNVGWIVDGPYSPLDTLESLATNSPDHTPLYFLLLNLWGHLVGADVATGRLLSLFAGLLGAAMIYRLTRDLVSPIAAIFALVILASNTFYNFYLLYLRMYPLLALNAAIVCWFYWRLLRQNPTPRRRDYVALGAACYALVNTHAISALLFIALGIYHLLHVGKDRRWLKVALTVLLSLALFSPWAVLLISAGVGQTFSSAAPTSDNTWEALGSWLSIGFSGSVTLLIVTLAGLAPLLRRRCKRSRRLLLMLVYYLIVLALFTQFVGIIVPGAMRLTAPGFALLIPCIALSLYQLYRLRKMLGILALVWLLGGIAYQQSDEWTRYLSISGRYTELIPWHAVSRAVTSSDLARANVVGYQFDPFRLNWRSKIDYPQNEYYFAKHGIKVRSAEDRTSFEEIIRLNTITEPAQWLMYRTNNVDATEALQLEAIMREAHYESCGSRELGIDTMLTEYRWEALECAPPNVLSRHKTALLDYEFYAAALSADGDTLLFVDRWAANEDMPNDGFNLSHQLISADWERVAQLDLPLVNEGKPRQFAIDIADVPAGAYRLMTILYDSGSGERYDWIDNPSQPAYMQTLAELVIPE